MQYIKAFVSGFLATIVFHQGIWAVLHGAGKVPAAAWDMTAVPPLGIPAVISLAFWGGLWGIALWLVIRNMAGPKYWLTATIVGAVAASAVALLVVFKIKGIEVQSSMIGGALILNAAWGFGVALFMRLARNIG